MTVRRLSEGWRRVIAILIFWITQNRVGHEHVVAADASEGQQVFKVSPRLVAVKRYFRFISSQATWRFADEEQLCVQVARRIVEHTCAIAHARAFQTSARFFD